MRLLTTAVALTFVIFGLSTSAAATESHGDLRLAGETLVGGSFSGQGHGELRLFPGPQLDLHGVGAEVVVEETRMIYHVFSSPVGPVGYEEEDFLTEEEVHEFKDAAFTLESFEPGFSGLVWMETPDEGRLHVTAANVSGMPLVAFQDPVLLVFDQAGTDGVHYEGDPLTHQASGDRYPVPAQTARAEGAFSLQLWDAAFKLTQDGGEESRFVAGESREQVAPGYVRVERTYYQIGFEQGALQTVGENLAWLGSPTIELDGTLENQKAGGTFSLDGEVHHVQNVPMKASGRLVLEPRPVGEIVELPSDETHIGTSDSAARAYGASEVSFSGRDVSLSFGSTVLGSDSSSLVPVAATAGAIGLVGLALALTPQGKWAILGAIAPLYAKTQRDRLLESPQRERLLQAIQANPGVHLSGLREIADLGWGTTVYHLRLMEKRELIVSVQRAGQRHFFVKTPGVDAARVRTAVSAIVGQETAHRVAFAVLSLPGTCQKELAEHLGVSRRVVAHHIARLHKAGLVEKIRDGSRVYCHPTPALGDALAILDTGEAQPRSHALQPAEKPVTAVEVEG